MKMRITNNGKTKLLRLSSNCKKYCPNRQRVETGLKIGSVCCIGFRYCKFKVCTYSTKYLENYYYYYPET